jgi:hypothetical protein
MEEDMTLKERLKQAGERCGFMNMKIEQQLEITETTLQALSDDLRENEPHARDEIAAFDSAVNALPSSDDIE